MSNKWLREPLLHFLLIGATLFFLYGLQNDQPVTDANHIVISEADIDRLLSQWEKRWQRLPTPAELDGIIAAQVREEVLYREALAMGLDKNDAVVHRRLAQKMEFIFSDLALQAEPTEDDLNSYLTSHPELFEEPARISFVQIYFNDDQRADRVEQDVAQTYSALTAPGSMIDAANAGDTFMFGQQHNNLSKKQVTRLFGKQFAEQVFNLPVDGWQEPIVSGFGIHLVKVDAKTIARTPELDEVRIRVLNEWQSWQRKQVNEQFYQSLRARYEVVIEDREPANKDTTGEAENQ